MGSILPLQRGRSLSYDRGLDTWPWGILRTTVKKSILAGCRQRAVCLVYANMSSQWTLVILVEVGVWWCFDNLYVPVLLFWDVRFVSGMCTCLWCFCHERYFPTPELLKPVLWPRTWLWRWVHARTTTARTTTTSKATAILSGYRQTAVYAQYMRTIGSRWCYS